MLAKGRPDARLAAFVSATGSAGTLAAGDHLKENVRRARSSAVEAVECPTLLYNGFGEHNIQGIGDKHVPLIHNVMNTDVVIGVSDRATDTLLMLFNTDEGRKYLVERRGVDADLVAELGNFGLSSLCNMSRRSRPPSISISDPTTSCCTVATDGAEMYGSEIGKAMPRYFGNRFDAVAPARPGAARSPRAGIDHVLELSHVDRKRIFNLGYFTWVEQQGVSLEDFQRVLEQSFWDGLLDLGPGLGRDDRRVQRGERRGAALDVMSGDCNASSAMAAARRRRRARLAVRLPACRPRGDDIDHVLVAADGGCDHCRRRRAQSVPALPALAVALPAGARGRPFGRRLGRDRRELERRA